MQLQGTFSGLLISFSPAFLGVDTSQQLVRTAVPSGDFELLGLQTPIILHVLLICYYIRQ